MSFSKKLAITALVVIVILMTITYAGISLFFDNHYYYNTIINGNDYSYMTPVQAEEIICQEIEKYSLVIEGREELHDQIEQSEIKLQYIFDNSLIEIKQKQKPGLWILGFFKEYSYDIPKLVEYKEDLLDQAINNLAFFRTENIRAPSDAYIKFSPEEGSYMVIGDSPGTELEKKKTKEAIRESLNGLEKKLNLEEKGCYKNAAVDGENPSLQAEAEKANKYISARIIYNWNGSEVTVDADTIQSWIIIRDNKALLDEDKIKGFVSEQAEAYDTYGKNRIFHTTDGREIELKGAAYGWKTDKDTEARLLTEAVKKGEVAKREPVYSYTAAEPGVKDIGNTYVEINLSSQHLYLYVDGAIVIESDFVSGNESRGWNTPAGLFGLTYKTKNAVLRGADYETPVNYWMPFNGNIGMHDAPWRGSFGGEVYKTNGSHGCINLPPENAKIIYEYLYTGFPVVCYY